MQLCSHINHEIWWGTHPELPVTEFYNRSNKCKKCYIRQQQESKQNRRLGVPPQPTTVAPPRGMHARAAQQQRAASYNSTLQNSMNQATMYNQPNNYVSMGTFSSAGYSSQRFNPVAPPPAAPPPPPPLPVTTANMVSRPPREINRKALNLSLVRRFRILTAELMGNQYAWPFNQPVDVDQLGLTDYREIIKTPMDLQTIMYYIENHKYDQNYMLYVNDVRLIWNNAKTYNKVNSEIYDFASLLANIFEEKIKTIIAEEETQARLESEKEYPSDICAFCAKTNGVVPIPPRPPGAPEQQYPQQMMVYDQLVRCDGACMRAFHPRCLNLSSVSLPWFCLECGSGRPVIHWDPAKSQHFYYYYPKETYESMELTEDEERYNPLMNVSVEAKSFIRQEDEQYREQDMYYDPLWCMWRCKSRDTIQAREDRHNYIISQTTPQR
eukprot:TRINITY_DN3468_c0_g1_i1.p1 TRINITY_DN3468_c0_g1~~TRINITY_DN3468_c0_g1_i1.p1  ORF type:complete len:439 (+),score=112.36 TRINITY_DN3468_c0_g1_i1:287-1603(+)